MWKYLHLYYAYKREFRDKNEIQASSICNTATVHTHLSQHILIQKQADPTFMLNLIKYLVEGRHSMLAGFIADNTSMVTFKIQLVSNTYKTFRSPKSQVKRTL